MSTIRCLFLGLMPLVLVLTGCNRSTRIGDFNAMSTKNIYCKNIDLTKLPSKQGVEGEDVRFGNIDSNGANIEDALDRALEAGNGNLMINVVVYVETRPFASGYRVRGTVVNVPYKPGAKDKKVASAKEAPAPSTSQTNLKK